MAATQSSFDWLAEALGASTWRWSLGAFGAIGAFSHDREPTVVAATDQALVVRSAAASLRIERIFQLRPVAFETISSVPRLWNHGIALCVAEHALFAPQRAGLLDAGEDGAAISPADRHKRCFDIGIASRQARVKLRSGMDGMHELLAGWQGATFSELPRPLLGELAASDLDWIIETPVGRLEVMHTTAQTISGSYPAFLSPGLLGSGRTHARTTPIPTGFVPCGYGFPPHPCQGKIFDRQAHARFQSMLDRFGLPELVCFKRKVEAALDRRQFEPPSINSRHELSVVRVTLRQRLLTDPGFDLRPWLEVYDHALLRSLDAARRN
ncbi:DUF6925 family protein [Pseudaminobacter sp. NGMCC 1.201702]|uniref:DUF6925 family protein n=1 Tax=Pseudaminobacter sp. NGMCC 1.201702 TaxID=3391825 RepID=UPI0039EEF60E